MASMISSVNTFRLVRRFIILLMVLLLIFLGGNYLRNSSPIHIYRNMQQEDISISHAHSVEYKHLRMAPLNPQEHYRPKWYRDIYGKVDPEDKSHVLQNLLGQHVDFSKYPRVVLLDLGARTYESSVKWFLVNYPGKFHEVYAFEQVPNVFHVPNENDSEVKGTRVVLLESTVGTSYKPSTVDIADFMQNTLKLRPNDMVVMKMDIEGAEWQVLKHLEESNALDLVDELLVEMHYHHPDLAEVGWNVFPKTLNETNEYLKHLRRRGLYVHPWP